MAKQEDKEICMIELPRNGLDNDYTFYKSGKIHRKYDRHIYPGGQNIEEWLSAEQIDDQLKERLLERCPPIHLKEITKILKIPNLPQV